MKKIILIMFMILVLCILVGCDTNHQSEYKVVDGNIYETHVYCSANSTCSGCEKWPVDVSTAYRVECENITSNMGSHQHYTITWINKKED